MKKVKKLAVIGSVLLMAIAVIGPVQGIHAMAYEGWGEELGKGGSDAIPGIRPRIWGYTEGGFMGNTLVNGSSSYDTNKKTFMATTDTNVNHDVDYILTCWVNGAPKSVTGGSSYGIVYTRLVGEINKTTYSKHTVESSAYGRFRGFTRIYM